MGVEGRVMDLGQWDYRWVPLVGQTARPYAGLARARARGTKIELTRRNIPFVKFGGLKFLDAAHINPVVFELEARTLRPIWSLLRPQKQTCQRGALTSILCRQDRTCAAKE
jgi:hypothetical protein